MKLYLHQFLSRTGLFKSKKALLRAVKHSEVRVGGKIITNPMYNFDKNKQRVFWRGRPIKPIGKKIYILINKPKGYLSSKLTPKDVGKKSVFDLIKIEDKLKSTLFFVGRLDEDTSGLLIITNDGNLSYKITSPDSNIEKTYEVVLAKPISKEDISKIEKGVVIDLEENGIVTKYKTKGCKIEMKDKLLITLTEGKKREVKRIFEAVGNKVISLKRLKIGKLELGNLKDGEYRTLSEEEMHIV